MIIPGSSFLTKASLLIIRHAIAELLGQDSSIYGESELLSSCNPYWGNVVFASHFDGKNSLIASAFADGYTAKHFAANDPTATGEPTYTQWLSEFSSSGSFGYVWNSNALADTGVISTTTVNIDITRDFILRAYNKSWPGDLCEGIFEFLDASDNVIVVLKTAADGTYSSGLWYGPSVGSLTKCGQSGAYNGTNQVLRFSNTSLVGIPLADSNLGFTYSADVSMVTKVRVSGLQARSTYTGGTGAAFVYLRYNTVKDEIGNLTYDYTYYILSDTISKFGESIYYDGTTYTTVDYSTSFDCGTSSWSVSAWIYYTAASGSLRRFFSTIASSSATWANRFYIGINELDRLTLGVYNATATPTNIYSSIVVPKNEWVHIAVSYSSGTYKLFINGVNVGENSAIPTITYDNLGLTIGAPYPSGLGFIGYIDDLVFTNGNTQYLDNFIPTGQAFLDSPCVYPE